MEHTYTYHVSVVGKDFEFVTDDRDAALLLMAALQDMGMITLVRCS